MIVHWPAASRTAEPYAPVPPRQRHHPHRPRGAGHRGAGCVQGRRADADRGHELRIHLRDADRRPARSASTTRCWATARSATDGWKAVSFHQPGGSFDADRWELYHIERGLLRVLRPRGRASREAPGAHRCLVGGGREVQCSAARPTPSRRFCRAGARPRRRRHFTFYPGEASVPVRRAQTMDRSHRITADISWSVQGRRRPHRARRPPRWLRALHQEQPPLLRGQLPGVVGSGSVG